MVWSAGPEWEGEWRAIRRRDDAQGAVWATQLELTVRAEGRSVRNASASAAWEEEVVLLRSSGWDGHRVLLATGFDLAELLPCLRVEVWVGAGAQKAAVRHAGQLFLFLVCNNPLLKSYKPGQVV